ncbi:MAG: hypothetical protein VYE77_08335 [Planctomycetota bacterium]|mgnify:FL=1|nr:hypothetical protein [Planctomycetota bacterium]
MTWLIFALMTVCSWGVYGVLLHSGQVAMADPVNGRYKAFLFVGVAYTLTAVIGSAVVLLLNGASWNMPGKGITLSTIAGIAGALGAFGVVLAFAANGTPSVVMSIVFAGAPIVNACVALAMHPPPGGLAALNWPFLLGILLAAAGGFLVSLYKPG